MEPLTPGRHCRLVAWSDLSFKVAGSNPDRKIYQATAKWEAHNFETKGVKGRVRGSSGRAFDDTSRTTWARILPRGERFLSF